MRPSPATLPGIAFAAAFPFLLGCSNQGDLQRIESDESSPPAEMGDRPPMADEPLTGAQPADAERTDRGKREASFDAELASLQTRLNLSEEQFGRVTPIMRETIDARREILRRYNIDLDAEGGTEINLGLLEARRLRRELEQIQTRTATKLNDILTDDQMEQYRQLQAENKQSIRDRLRAK